MASIFTRGDSPYYWLRHKNTDGKWAAKSTGIRWDGGPKAKREAQGVEASATAEEKKQHGTKSGGGFDDWVPQFLEFRYRSNEATLRRNQRCWATVRAFLSEHGIATPAQVRREHFQAYTTWRTGCGSNTMRMEWNLFRLIIKEARIAGRCTHIPYEGLKIKKTAAPEKPEISWEEEKKIRDRIAHLLKTASTPERKRNAWYFFCSFEIAMAHGCRLSETCLPMDRIDVVAKKITFRRKGGRMDTVDLNPSLLPLIEKLKAENATHTYEPWNSRELPSLKWTHFFEDVQLTHLCFHCTRVTFISRMARAGMPEAVVMQLVGHGSTEVHRVYRRVAPSEIAPFWGAVTFENKPST